jgi:iron complex transport system ATP-binding protein
MTDDTPLLEVRNLKKTYENGYQAVKGVSYSLPSGKLVGLIGPNGCGKTTMMRCINKMHKMTSGDVLIDGHSILPMSHSEVSRLVSNVPAEMSASFGLTVFETVMLGRYPYLSNMWWESDEDEAMVEETLKKFGIHHLQDRALNMISSGERQRVLIAKAYVQNPRLMLVDEPTSHLDMRYKLDVMEYLRAMVRQDMTVLVAEHDISLMARYCDLCIIMKQGEIVAIGEPKKVITSDVVRDVYQVEASVGFDADGMLYVLPKRFVKKNGEQYELTESDL